MLRMIVLLLMLSGTALAASGAVSLPDDARLAPVRAGLQKRIDAAAAAGLPADALVSKVREGLAKGVEAQRISSAAMRLADDLEAAQRFVIARRPGAAAPGLVRALAEARMAGLDLATLPSLVAADRPPQPAQRAVEVLTDLSPLFQAGRVRLRVRVERAGEVRVIGSWDAWAESTPLRSTGQPGLWEVWLDLPPGTHRYRFLVDGRAITPSDGARTLPDDFGGRDAVINVSEGQGMP